MSIFDPKNYKALFFLFFKTTFFLVFTPIECFAQESVAENIESEFFSKFKLSGLLDLRAISSSENQSWLDGGLGKTRYGGDASNDSRQLLRASHLALLLDGNLSDSTALHLNLDLDTDPSPESKGGFIDFPEAFLKYQRSINPYFKFQMKGGMFFPDISLENTAKAWNSKYTLTPSAINSWLAEEVRIVGIEPRVTYAYFDNEVSLASGLFMFNDPVGQLLAWRGWSFDDRLTGFHDRLPLPDSIAALSPGGIFQKQDKNSLIFDEIDHRPGAYVLASWENHRYFKFNFMHYDNRAETNKFVNGQYAWHTNFNSFGLSIPLLDDSFEIVSQYMLGTTRIGKPPPNKGLFVNSDFSSFFVLGSYLVERHRYSLRFDRFDVEDRDDVLEKDQDNNNEHGFAWTLAYRFEIDSKQFVTLETIAIDSHRQEFVSYGLSPDEKEFITQISYQRLF